MATDVIHDAGAAMPRHKAEYSDLCDVCRPLRIRAKRVTLLHRSMVEFGYATLTRDEVGAAYDIAIEREPTAEEGIIPRLVRSLLVEAGFAGDNGQCGYNDPFHGPCVLPPGHRGAHDEADSRFR
jgi:hypothetical protein